MAALVAAMLGVSPPAEATRLSAAASPATDPVEQTKAEAKRLHRRIEIESLRGERSTTWANADGKTLHAELSTTPVRVRRGGGWVPVDLTLEQRDGVVRPKAAAALELSAGGTTTAVKLRHEQGRSAVRWPSALPVPKLAGNTATYLDAVAPGIDLVVSATATGFSQSVVIRERPAKGISFQIPVSLPAGMRFGTDPAGRPSLMAAIGGQTTAVADVSAATLVDATAAGGDLERGIRGLARVSTGADAAGPVLKVTADPAFLGDPAVTYPVTVIVPSTWVGAQLDQDTFISNISYPNSQTLATWLRTGKSSSGAETWRTYLRFVVGGTELDGAQILNADLRLWNYRSNTCGMEVGSGIVAKRITSDWNPSTLTWSNQPATTTTNQSANKAAYSDLCSWGEGELYYSIEGIVQDWADGVADYGVQLRAVSESDATNWRQYRASEYTGASGRGPVLFIDYEPPEELTVLSLRDGPGEPTTPFTFEQAQAAAGRMSETPSTVEPVTEEAAAHLTETAGVEFTDAEMDDYAAPEGLTQEEWEAASNPNAPPDQEWGDPEPDPQPVEQTIELPLVADATTTNWGYEWFGEPLLVAGSYAWGDGTWDLSHSYLRFNNSALAGAQVLSATLKLFNEDGFCDTNAIAINAYNVTSAWDASTLSWGSQPAVGAAPIAPAATGACDAQEFQTWPVTPIVQAWATGTANHGIALRAVPEGGSGKHERYFHSSIPLEEAAHHPPTLVVTIAVTGPAVSGQAMTTAAVPSTPGKITFADCESPEADATIDSEYGWVKNQYKAYCDSM